MRLTKSQSWILVATCGVWLVAAPARADEKEIRIYRASVDGRAGGTFSMEFVRGRDGTDTITATADVKVRAYFREYRYSHQGTEIWSKGTLTALTSATNDDGKKTTVVARQGARGLAVAVDGKERLAPGNAVTSTGAVLPFAIANAVDVVLLDVDDGTEAPVRITPMGACSVSLQGAAVRGQKYQLKGKDVDHEWWFDEHSRMIRQSLLWDGHRVILELVEIQRP